MADSIEWNVAVAMYIRAYIQGCSHIYITLY